MSARADLVADLVAAVAALATGAPVANWPGEDLAFNVNATRPSVWVRYLGLRASEYLENVPVSYAKAWRFQLIVQHDDHAALMVLLDSLEAGINGLQLGTGQLELDAENQERADAGVYTYSQAYNLDETVAT